MVIMQRHPHDWLIMCFKWVNHFMRIKKTYISIFIRSNNAFRMRNESSFNNWLLIGWKIGIDLIVNLIEDFLCFKIIMNQWIRVKITHNQVWVWQTYCSGNKFLILFVWGTLRLIKELTVWFYFQVWTDLFILDWRNLVTFNCHLWRCCN